ncbi:MAG: hypothetical protein JWQ09_4351 [Segetibacter sp.]|nr:hypothetical protein [Segetibacter sp.]
MDALENRLVVLENKIAFLEQIISARSPQLTHNLFSPSSLQRTDDINIEAVKKRVHQLLENWPAKLGILFILIGLGSFLTYAFTHDWFSLLVRFLICFTISFSMSIVGVYFLSSKKPAGHFLVTSGVTGMVMSLWAAGVIYRIFPAEVIFPAMLSVILAQVFIAFIYKSEPLVNLSTIFMLTIPLLVDSSMWERYNLMVYFCTINVSTIAALLFQGWPFPALFASIAMLIYFTLFYSTVAVWFAIISFIFLFAPWLFLSARSENKWQRSLIQGVITSAFSLTWFFFYIQDLSPFFETAILLILGGSLLTSSYVLCCKGQFSQRQSALAWVWGISCAYCVIRINQKCCSHTAMNTAYFLEIMAGCIFAFYCLQSVRVTKLVSYTFTVPFFISVIYFLTAPAPFTHILFWSLLVGLLSAQIIVQVLKQINNAVDTYFLLLGFQLASFFFATGVVWKAAENLMPTPDIAHQVALVLYTISGIGALTFGNSSTHFKMGYTLIIGVSLRLLGFEVWSMSIVQQIGTFLFIGMLFLTTAFIQRKHKNGSTCKESSVQIT